LRGSRTVLREAAGETPVAYSPTDFVRLRGGPRAWAGHAFWIRKRRILEGEEVTNIDWVGAQKMSGWAAGRGFVARGLGVLVSLRPMRLGAAGWKGEEVCGLSRQLLTIFAALAAGARVCLVEPAKIFRAKIAELLADGVIGGAALSLFRRRLLLLLLQQEPVKLVIFTHRNQQ
jgi:hypothetical protein